MRDHPFLETPHGADSTEQPPAACVHREAGMLCTQSHPAGVARSPAFIGNRAECPCGALATGEEMSLTEEQREVGERAEI